MVLAIIAPLFLAGCGWFGAAEKYKTESGKTTYRSAEENSNDTVTPSPQTIPGESRKAKKD